MMKIPTSLASRIGAIGVSLLMLALASISLTLWGTWQLEGGAAAVNEAGRMRMQTWRLAQTLSTGDGTRLQEQLQQFEQTLELLRVGDPQRPLLVPHDAASQQAFARVRRDWAELRAGWATPTNVDTVAISAQADQFVRDVDVFVTAIESQLAKWTALVNAFQFAMMALAIGSAVALLYTAYVFVFNPLARLQAGLSLVREGDLAARVDVNRQDEFGLLSDGFNRMASTLQSLYQSLEAKVQEKTAKLETEHARLMALYQAAAFVTTATALEPLARGFAKQVRQVALADASAVRWSDESNQRYIMLASDCLPQHVIDAEQCVPTGGCFCGQPQQFAQTRVIPIMPTAGGAMPGHCVRAGFDSMISIPVRFHERMVGEINLFYRHRVELGPDDRNLLDTLASHLAGAIEGLRAGALEREAAVAEERGLLARELHDSIAQSLSFLKIQAGLLRDELKRDDSARINQTLSELDAGIQESLNDVRELLVHFRTRTNGEDIAAALKTTLQKFELQSGLVTHLTINGDGLPLAPDLQVQVLHVVQEALSNVRKHANAREVWVEIEQSPQWRVEVRDDGGGFEPHQSDETHVGLRIMNERAQAIGAAVEVISVVGSGTCVVLTLPPYQARRAA